MYFATAREATAFFYVLIDVFCAGIIGTLLYTTLSDVERTNKRLHLVGVLVSVILYCISDSIWVLSYSNVIIPSSIAARYITNIFMYSVMVACAYAICRFFFSIWESVTSKKPDPNEVRVAPISNFKF